MCQLTWFRLQVLANIVFYIFFIYIVFHYSRWVQTGTFLAKSFISSLSWNLEGNRLLTGGANLQLWRETHNNDTQDEPSTGKIETFFM